METEYGVESVRKRYANVFWTGEDLMGEQAANILGKKFSREEAEDFLESMEDRLRVRMIEVGWDLLASEATSGE